MSNDIVSYILSLIKPVLTNMIRFGQVKIIKSGKTQSLQILRAGNDIVENVKFIEPFGLTSYPLENSETVVLSIQGSPINNVVLNVGSRELRIKTLTKGEVCLYDAFGNQVYLKDGGVIDLIAPSQVNIKTARLVVDADIIDIGDAGQPVARLGDDVEVDPVTHKGKIITASQKVRASWLLSLMKTLI